jgi:hypothetical protein
VDPSETDLNKEVAQHSAMLDIYKPSYFSGLVRALFGQHVDPVDVRHFQHGIDVLCLPHEGRFVYATVGFGVCRPGTDYPPIELLAISDRQHDHIAPTLADIGASHRGDDPLEPFHKIRFAEGDAPPNRFFLLDAGCFEHGWNVRRIIAVPVSDKEYEAMTPRGELTEGEVPQAWAMLDIPGDPEPLGDVPAPLRSRWAL